MIRKLLLPLVAVALLGGCVTSGYGYRHQGGNYYGAPSVDDRYYSPYGSYYGGTYGGYYGQSYGYGYGYPYGYHPYYGNQYYYYYGVPRVYYPTPVQRPPVDPTPDADVSPWRDLERLRARVRGNRMPAGTTRSAMPQVDPGLSSRRERMPAGMTQPAMPQVDPGLPSPRRRPVSVGTSIPMPQHRMSVNPPQPRSAPAPRSDGSALGGSARRMRKGDPSTETAP